MAQLTDIHSRYYKYIHTKYYHISIYEDRVDTRYNPYNVYKAYSEFYILLSTRVARVDAKELVQIIMLKKI